MELIHIPTMAKNLQVVAIVAVEAVQHWQYAGMRIKQRFPHLKGCVPLQDLLGVERTLVKMRKHEPGHVIGRGAHMTCRNIFEVFVVGCLELTSLVLVTGCVASLEIVPHQ